MIMKNDKKIRDVLWDIKLTADHILNLPNFDAYTDRQIEELIKKSKKLEKLHLDNFKEK